MALSEKSQIKKCGRTDVLPLIKGGVTILSTGEEKISSFFVRKI